MLENQKILAKSILKFKPKIIIHLAAIVPIKVVNENKKRTFKVNVTGTKNLVRAILQNKNEIKWVFFSSTSHVYSSSKKKIKTLIW